MNETLLLNAAKRSLQYLAQIQDRFVAPDSKAIGQLAQLNEPLPPLGMDAGEVLHLLDARCSPATMGVAGPRFFGFVIGGSLPVALAANWLAGAWDQNSALYQIAPGTAHVEQIALRWLVDLFGLPPDSGGAFVTGATVANFAALAAARHSVYIKAGWDIEGKGLIGSPPVTVVIGEEAHPSVFKSLGLLGLGRNRVVRVPVDDQGRMRADKLPKIKGPAIVCLQAGNVNTGSFDPIGEIWKKANGAGGWGKVDGGFGLWAVAAPDRPHLAKGIGLLDSFG